MTIEFNAESARTSSVGPSSSWDGAKMFINDLEVPLLEPFFLRRGVESRLKLVVKSLQGQEISLNSASDKDLADADPGFGEWVAVDGDVVEWKLNQKTAKSGMLDLVILMRNEIHPLVVKGLFMSTNLTEEVKEIQLNGRAFPPDAMFKRGIPQPVSLTYHTGSPAASWRLNWYAALGSGLIAGDVRFSSETSPATQVTASNRSGTFSIGLKGAGFTEGMATPLAKVLGSLEDEVLLELNGKPLQSGVTLDGNTEYTLAVKAKGSSPVNGKLLKLDWVRQLSGVSMEPDSGTPQLVNTTTGAVWTLKTGDDSGNFSVKATFTQFPLASDEMLMTVEAKKWELRFTILGLNYPRPPEEAPAFTNVSTHQTVKVTNGKGEPVAGVQVKYIYPRFPDGTGTTDLQGVAKNSVLTSYAEEGLYKIAAQWKDDQDRPYETWLWLRCVHDKP